MHAAAGSPKLPVLAVVRHAWRSVAANLGLFCRLVWPWLALFAMAGLAGFVGVVVNSGFGTPSPALIGGAFAFPALVVLVAVLLSIPVFCIGWHRGVLRNERPASPILVNATTWGYLGQYLLIVVTVTIVNGIVVLLALSVAGISLGLGEGEMSLQRLAALAPYLQLASIPGLVMANRLIMVLPARAVGEPASFGRAWRSTRGNTLRLTLGAGLVTLPFIVVQGVTQVAMIAAPMSALAAGLGLLTFLTLVFSTLAWLSYISIAYAELTPSYAGPQAA